MSHKKTIGMLVLAVSAAQAEQCASSASSVDDTAESSSDAFVVEGLEECDTSARADPPEN